jgi:hypothetical protein
MNWLKGMSGYLGYVIGAVIILPLILVAYNKLFVKNNNDATRFVEPYMINLTEVKFSIPKVKSFSEVQFKAEIITTRYATKNMGRDGSERTKYLYQDVVDPVTKKIIRIAMFDHNIRFWDNIADSTIIARINKDDYKNPEYGTKEHPVMCFAVKNIRAQMPNPDVYQFETLDEQFKYNIFMYLTYVMPHKEFKKRFGLPHTSD